MTTQPHSAARLERLTREDESRRMLGDGVVDTQSPSSDETSCEIAWLALRERSAAHRAHRDGPKDLPGQAALLRDFQ